MYNGVINLNIAVTGGAGFIGSNYINYLLKKYTSYKIICIDSLTYAGNKDNLLPFIENKNFKFYKIDITDKTNLEDCIVKEKIDVIVNFAAETHVDNSIVTPEIFFNTNITGVVNLLEICKKYNIRFHQISTDEVYGSLELESKNIFTEESILHPSSPYSSSKASADLIALSYYKTFNVPVTISRCSNNYGPNQFPEKLIPKTIINLLSGKNVPIYGDGKNVRDWLYVEDHCIAVDLIVNSGKMGEIYNIGSNNEISNLEIVYKVLEKLNADKKLIEFVKDRPGHDRRYAIDYTKIKNDLGFVPKYNFEDALECTVEWYKTNKTWWEKLIK